MESQARKIAGLLKNDLCRYEGLGWYVNNRSVIYSMGSGWIAFFIPNRLTSEHIRASYLDPGANVLVERTMDYNAMDVCDSEDLNPLAGFIMNLAREIKILSE